MKKIFWYYVFLIIIYISLLTVPIVNIPLNDDYLYFESVERLLKDGVVSIPSEAAPAFLPQLFYSASFSYIFGLSHSALIFVTIILSGTTVVASFTLMRKFLTEKYAMLGSLLLLFNPIFFNLSHTFMTDIHALAFAVFSVLAFQKVIERNHFKYILIGTIFASISFLIRQWYFLLPFAVLIFYFFKDRKFLFQKKIIFTLIVLPITILGIWFVWNLIVNGASSNIRWHAPFQTDPAIIFNNFMKVVFFTSVFLFPLGLLPLLNIKKVLKVFRESKITSSFLIVALIILQIGWIIYRYFSDLGMIFPGNHAIFLYGAQLPGIVGTEIPAFWLPVSLLGLLIIAYSLLKILQKGLTKNIIFLLVIAASIPLLPTIGVKDRYFMLLIPLFLIPSLYVIKEFRFFKMVLIASVIFFAVWYWYGTYNYLNYHLARREGVDFLLQFNGAEKLEGNEYRVKEPYSIMSEVPEGYEILKKMDLKDAFGINLGSLFVIKKL